MLFRSSSQLLSSAFHSYSNVTGDLHESDLAIAMSCLFRNRNALQCSLKVAAIYASSQQFSDCIWNALRFRNKQLIAIAKSLSCKSPVKEPSSLSWPSQFSPRHHNIYIQTMLHHFLQLPSWSMCIYKWALMIDCKYTSSPTFSRSVKIVGHTG